MWKFLSLWTKIYNFFDIAMAIFSVVKFSIRSEICRCWIQFFSKNSKFGLVKANFLAAAQLYLFRPQPPLTNCTRGFAIYSLMKVNGTLHMNPVTINRISNVNLCKESLFNISGIFGYPYIKYGIPKMRHFEYPFTFPKLP